MNRKQPFAIAIRAGCPACNKNATHEKKPTLSGTPNLAR